MGLDQLESTGHLRDVLIESFETLQTNTGIILVSKIYLLCG